MRSYGMANRMDNSGGEIDPLYEELIGSAPIQSPYMSAKMQQAPSMNPVGPATAAASGAMAAGPAGAAIGAGGAFLSQYLAARAQREQQKRQLESQAAETHASQQQGAMSNLMNAYKAIL